MLGIPLVLSSDASYEGSGFSKALLEKSLEFVPSRKDGTVTFNLGLVLLPVEVNPIPKKQGYKGYALRAHDTWRVKIILALLTKIIALYVGATLVQVVVPGLESPIAGSEVCFAMFLALHKQF